MDAQEFIAYIKEPETLDKDSLAKIEKLSGEFPYCQSLKILHLLNLRMTNHVMYSEQLKKTAAYIADRKRLKELISSFKEEKAEDVNLRDAGNHIPDTSDSSSQSSEEQSQLPATSDQPPAPSTQPPEPIVPVIEQDEEARLLALKEIVEARLREITEEREEKKSPSKDELIDKFIEEEPSISRPKAEFFDPVKVAKSSQKDDEGIVSETLARIHIQQGNIEKAIEIYRKLSLNFPEKSAYFAAQIEKISTDN